MKRTGAIETCAEERTRVNRIRGIVMLLAAAVAIWKGWQIHRGETAVLAYGLGAIALALGIWHLRRSDGVRPGPSPDPSQQQPIHKKLDS
jgi:hypothetical protein